MRRRVPQDPYVDAKLMGILLAGMLGQTRTECSARAHLCPELRPSGVYPVVSALYPPERPPKA
jgi:hypothetical protein